MLGDDTPRDWQSMSFDYKLMFGFHGLGMIFFLLAGLIPKSIIIGIFILSAVIGFIASVLYRMRQGWNWQEKPGVWAILSAVLTLILMSFFWIASTQFMSVDTSFGAVWTFMIANFSVFFVLHSLNIIRFSKIKFEEDCHRREKLTKLSDIDEDRLSLWKRILQFTYSTAFLGVWVGGVSYFYFFGKAFRNGSDVPTEHLTAELQNRNSVVFVSEQTENLINLLSMCLWIGIPSIMVTGLFLHFILRVPVISGVDIPGAKK